jgi:hypothetical protein
MGLTKREGLGWKLLAAATSIVAVVSSMWAAASTAAMSEVRRIDVQGTQKTQAVELRVTALETRVIQNLDEMNRSLREMKDDFKAHVKDTRDK